MYNILEKLIEIFGKLFWADVLVNFKNVCYYLPCKAKRYI